MTLPRRSPENPAVVIAVGWTFLGWALIGALATLAFALFGEHDCDRPSVLFTLGWLPSALLAVTGAIVVTYHRARSRPVIRRVFSGVLISLGILLTSGLGALLVTSLRRSNVCG